MHKLEKNTHTICERPKIEIYAYTAAHAKKESK